MLRSFLILCGLLLFTGCFQNFRPQLGQDCDASAAQNPCGEGYQCVLIDSLQAGRCVPENQDPDEINEAFNEDITGTTDGAKEDAGSGDGTTDGTAVVDAGSGDGSTDGTAVVDAGAADGTTDGTAVVDAGSSDGSSDGSEVDAGVVCDACVEGYVLDSADCSCTRATATEPENTTCDSIDANGPIVCQCNEGFQENPALSWNPTNQQWEGSCEPIGDCVHSSECGQHEECNDTSFNCECEYGFHDLEQGAGCENINECEGDSPPCLQRCEDFDGSYLCSCYEGYYGDGLNCTLYDPQPTDAACTTGDSGDISCSCPSGYEGAPQWVGGEDQKWDNNENCTVQDCPSNATNHPNCACAQGFSGTVTWDDADQEWSGDDCASVACPANATSDSSGCLCDDGFSGTINWDNDVQEWRGDDCASVECPANATSDSSDCLCNEGFIGTINWDGGDQVWRGVCDYPPVVISNCPDGLSAESRQTISTAATVYNMNYGLEAETAVDDAIYWIRIDEAGIQNMGEATTYMLSSLLEDGDYEFEVYYAISETELENLTPTICYLTVDNTAPTVAAVETLFDYGVFTNAFVWLADAPDGETATYTWCDDSTCDPWPDFSENHSLDLELEMGPGDYTIYVKAKDALGNVSETEPLTFTVAGSALLATPTFDTVSGSLEYEAIQDFSWILVANASSYDVKIDDNDWTNTTDTSWTIGPYLSLGEHTLTVRAKDASGNISRAVTKSFDIVDTTAPASPTNLEYTPQSPNASDAITFTWLEPEIPEGNEETVTYEYQIRDGANYLGTTDQEVIIAGDTYNAGESTYFCVKTKDWQDNLSDPATCIAIIIAADNVICGENEHVNGDACVACAAGTTNEAGDETASGETFCVATLCVADERVDDNNCVACGNGTTNAAGDDASGNDTSCDDTMCAENEHVFQNTCEDCAPGTTNEQGDNASGADTSCVATMCDADEHVSGHTCVACSGSTTNAQGDNASGPDTHCDESQHQFTSTINTDLLGEIHVGALEVTVVNTASNSITCAINVKDSSGQPVPIWDPAPMTWITSMTFSLAQGSSNQQSLTIQNVSVATFNVVVGCGSEVTHAFNQILNDGDLCSPNSSTNHCPNGSLCVEDLDESRGHHICAPQKQEDLNAPCPAHKFLADVYTWKDQGIVTFGTEAVSACISFPHQDNNEALLEMLIEEGGGCNQHHECALGVCSVTSGNGMCDSTTPLGQDGGYGATVPTSYAGCAWPLVNLQNTTSGTYFCHRTCLIPADCPPDGEQAGNCLAVGTTPFDSPICEVPDPPDPHDFTYPCLDDGQRLLLAPARTLTTPEGFLDNITNYSLEFAVKFQSSGFSPMEMVTVTDGLGIILTAEPGVPQNTTSWKLKFASPGLTEVKEVVVNTSPNKWQKVMLSRKVENGNTTWIFGAASLEENTVSEVSNELTADGFGGDPPTVVLGYAEAFPVDASSFFLNYLFVDQMVADGSFDDLYSYVFDPAAMESNGGFTVADENGNNALTASNDLQPTPVCCGIENDTTGDEGALAFGSQYSSFVVDIDSTDTFPGSTFGDKLTMAFTLQPKPDAETAEDFDTKTIFASAEIADNTPQMLVQFQRDNNATNGQVPSYNLSAGLKWANGMQACTTSISINSNIANSPIEVSLSFGPDGASDGYRMGIRREGQQNSKHCGEQNPPLFSSFTFGENEDQSPTFAMDNLRLWNTHLDISEYNDLDGSGAGYNPNCLHEGHLDCSSSDGEPYAFFNFNSLSDPDYDQCDLTVTPTSGQLSGSFSASHVSYIDGLSAGNDPSPDPGAGFSWLQTVGTIISDTFMARIPNDDPNTSAADTHFAWGLNIRTHEAGTTNDENELESGGYFSGIVDENGENSNIVVAKIERGTDNRSFYYSNCREGSSLKLEALTASENYVYAAARRIGQTTGFNDSCGFGHSSGNVGWVPDINEDGFIDGSNNQPGGHEYYLLRFDFSPTYPEVVVRGFDTAVEGFHDIVEPQTHHIAGIAVTQIDQGESLVLAGFFVSGQQRYSYLLNTLAFADGDGTSVFQTRELYLNTMNCSDIRCSPKDIATVGNKIFVTGLTTGSNAFSDATGSFLQQFMQSGDGGQMGVLGNGAMFFGQVVQEEDTINFATHIAVNPNVVVVGTKSDDANESIGFYVFGEDANDPGHLAMLTSGYPKDGSAQNLSNLMSLTLEFEKNAFSILHRANGANHNFFLVEYSCEEDNINNAVCDGINGLIPSEGTNPLTIEGGTMSSGSPNYADMCLMKNQGENGWSPAISIIFNGELNIPGIPNEGVEAPGTGEVHGVVFH